MKETTKETISQFLRSAIEDITENPTRAEAALANTLGLIVQHVTEDEEEQFIDLQHEVKQGQHRDQWLISFYSDHDFIPSINDIPKMMEAERADKKKVERQLQVQAETIDNYQSQIDKLANFIMSVGGPTGPRSATEEAQYLIERTMLCICGHLHTSYAEHCQDPNCLCNRLVLRAALDTIPIHFQDTRHIDLVAVLYRLYRRALRGDYHDYITQMLPKRNLMQALWEIRQKTIDGAFDNILPELNKPTPITEGDPR